MGSLRVGSERVWRGRRERGEVGSGRESVGCDSGEVERVGVKVWSVRVGG